MITELGFTLDQQENKFLICTEAIVKKLGLYVNNRTLSRFFFNLKCMNIRREICVSASFLLLDYPLHIQPSPLLNSRSDIMQSCSLIKEREYVLFVKSETSYEDTIFYRALYLMQLNQKI